jgi:hypothetical protein
MGNSGVWSTRVFRRRRRKITIPIRKSTAAPRIPPTIPPIAPPERLLVALFEVAAVEIWLEFADVTVAAEMVPEDMLPEDMVPEDMVPEGMVLEDVWGVFISVVDEVCLVLWAVVEVVATAVLGVFISVVDEVCSVIWAVLVEVVITSTAELAAAAAD